MKPETFQDIQPSIPHEPGIYKYYAEHGELLYVGKAKDLRKRVSSYFNKTWTSYKTHELVQRIHRIEFTIVNSEQDAFLLENTLIKEFQPRYNINLKDDKTYPYIVIKKEAFPRIFFTRRLIPDGSEYLGPFTSVGKVRELLGFIKQNIPLRTCKLDLSEKNIIKGKYKVCLEYHLGNCLGPCAGLQTTQDYEEGISRMRELLRGNLSPVMQYFKKEMKDHAADMAFEKAEAMRKKIEHLQQYQARSAVVSSRLGDLDVFSVASEGEEAHVNFLMVRNGAVVDTKTVTLEKRLEETPEEVLGFAILHFREQFRSHAHEIILPFAMEYPEPDVKITVPKGGDRKKLLELSEKNVNFFILEAKRKKMLHLGEGQDDEEILAQLQEDLSLQETPRHIECFDNSNFQGSSPVSAMVCFRNGQPSKKDYRRFHVKTVEGINDFATMKEVVGRRYKRLMEEGMDLPQLVVIDGGKGQLGAAMEIIDELGLRGRMTVVGLAKQEEEIFFAGDRDSLKLPYDGSSLKLIRRVRDEVHRFGITFHRQTRSKAALTDGLDGIKGIGRNTADQLLKAFRSVTNIAAADLATLENEIGKAKAGIVFRHFRKEDEPDEQANGAS
jgi:excinuclease ABC subunit C